MSTRTFSCLLFAIFLLAVGCKKNHSTPTPVTGYKLQLISGGGQTDTIGQYLPNAVSILPMRDDTPMRGGYLRFETMSCDNTPVDDDIAFGDPYSPSDSIIVSYSWQLNQTIGTQTVKVILLDSVKDHLDSITVTATGIAPSSGWHTSGCIPIFTFCQTFAQLPSGRIFTALHLGSYQSSYPYYSDDDGATWHAVTSFPITTSQISTIVTTKDNEVLISIPNTGIYYSGDKGQTWQQRTSGLPMSYYYGDLSCTATGILIANSGYTGQTAYYSADKGVTWQPMNGLLIGSSGFTATIYSFAGSMTDGTIIAILDNSLRESRDGAADWTWINTPFKVNDMLVDSNNYIDIATEPYPGSMPMGIYQSRDTGQTWTFVYDPSSLSGYDKSITQLTEKNGQCYFYASNNNLLTRTSNFSTYNVINPPVPIPGGDGGRVSFSYIVTNDNHFIMSTERYGLFYQVP